MMLRALAALIAISLAAPAAALGYVPGDPNVPVFSAIGPNPPSAETPTNFSMVTAAPIALPSLQTGPAAMNQSFTGSVSGLTLTASPGLPLPAWTQIMGAGIVGASNGNYPVVISGANPTYTLNNSTAAPTGSISITTQPLGGQEDAIVAWDTQYFQNFDTGFAFGCLRAEAISGIDHVVFHLNGGTSGGSVVTATTTTKNSTTGAPDYCFAAPTSLFVGHNGTHQVDAIVYPVAGWPVVMQSAQPVSMPASSATATIQGWTPANAAVPGAVITNKLVEITNSSDPTTFPNAAVGTVLNSTGKINFSGLYCVIAGASPDTFQLEEASVIGSPGTKQTTICTIQLAANVSGTAATVTGPVTSLPGGTPIVGQTVVGSFATTGSVVSGSNVLTLTTGLVPTAGETVKGTGIPGGSTIVSGGGPTFVMSANATATTSGTEAITIGTRADAVVAVVTSPGTINSSFTLSNAEMTATWNLTLAGAIPATASGATFTMTPWHAGESFEKALNQNMGSLFFTANPAGANVIPEVAGYVSNTGNNSNPATISSPALTLSGALLAITPTNALSTPFSGSASTQTIGSASVTPSGGSPSTCTTFTQTGNVTGAAPYLINQPVKFDGVSTPTGVLVEDGIYFVKSNSTNSDLTGDAITISATPGGACINDTVIATGTNTCFSGANICINLYQDYSWTTLKLQCVSSGSVTCDDGHPATFALGDGGTNIINRFARLGYLTVTRDLAHSTFDNVVINSEGGITPNGFNDSGGGLGVEAVHVLSIKGVIPTVSLPLLQPILSGQPITSIVVDTTTLTNSGFTIIPATTGHQGSETTQLIDGGNCIPSVGPGGVGAITTVTVPSAPTSVGTTTVIPLVATPTARVFNAFNACPIGTPITLQNNWSYIGGVNFWFDQSLMQSPYALTIGPGGASQIARSWSGAQTSTGSTTIKLGQPYNGMARVANSVSSKADSKGMTNTFMIVESRIDQGGDLAVSNVNQENTFTGTIDNGSGSAGTILTVPGTPSGSPLAPGELIQSGAGVFGGTFIQSQLSGPTGGAGTYSVNKSQLVAMGTIVGGFGSYGLSAPEVDDFATINGSVSGSILTVNSISSGVISPYMFLTYTGQAGTIFIDSQIDATHFSLNGSATSISSGTITLHRSIWKIGPPGNTIAGNTLPLPEMNSGYGAIWSCTGFPAGGSGPLIPYFDRGTSTVILAGGPGSSSGSNCPLDGNSYITLHTGIHEDMQTVQSFSGYLSGLMIEGLTIQNSQGYGYAILQAAPTIIQNVFNGDLNVQLFLDLAGQNSYPAAAMSNANRNLLFRDDTWNSTNNAAGGAAVSALNGTFVWDGATCGANAGFWTGLIATIPGIVIRNTNWPNMPVGASPGNC